MSADTIVAKATPEGRSGVAVIRISGSKVKEITFAMLGCELLPRYANYLPFFDEKGEVLDEGIALFFPHPHSFTGEDILELQGHGGPVVVDLLLQRILELGARLARPGEFSERAFLNGKIDLTQAEAIADLIEASGKQAARSAMRSLQGEFSKVIHEMNEKIIHLRTHIEAAIDFADEEINFLSDHKIHENFFVILNQLKEIIAKAKQGHLLKEGVKVAIIGQPNVGKSSLLNALSGREVAIVTDIPGTTRDVLRDHLLVDGMPLHIVDTAGLRESEDIIEQEGIRRAHQEMKQADFILYVMDANSPHDFEKEISTLSVSQPIILIRNKIDLIHAEPAIQKIAENIIISISAKKGWGIDLLKQQLKKQIGFQDHAEGIFLARRRHLDALARVKFCLENGLNALQESRARELVAEDLRQASLSLSEITGEFTADDLLGRIFSSFCIGK